MKEYMAPELEKIEYAVEECLTSSSITSGVGKESENGDSSLGGI